MHFGMTQFIIIFLYHAHNHTQYSRKQWIDNIYKFKQTV